MPCYERWCSYCISEKGKGFRGLPCCCLCQIHTLWLYCHLKQKRFWRFWYSCSYPNWNPFANHVKHISWKIFCRPVAGWDYGWYNPMLAIFTIFMDNIANNFHADMPNQKWCTGFTYLFLKNEDVRYNCAVVDLYDRSVVAGITDQYGLPTTVYVRIAINVTKKIDHCSVDRVRKL